MQHYCNANPITIYHAILKLSRVYVTMQVNISNPMPQILYTHPKSNAYGVRPSSVHGMKEGRHRRHNGVFRPFWEKMSSDE